MAATVNGQVVKQSALNRELAAWAGDGNYVAAFDQANTSNTLPDGGTVSVEGQGTGTYNSVWVSSVLNNIIVAAAVHQHLAQTGALPDAATVSATRSLLEFAEPGWYGLPGRPSADTLTERFAEEAAVRPPSRPAPPPGDEPLSQAYTQYSPYFFSERLHHPGRAPSQTDAQAEAAAGLPNTDPQICYDQAQLEAQPRRSAPP